MKKTTKNSFKILIVMRHGERIDKIKNKIINKNQKLKLYDPELTKNGIFQSISIGNQILNRLDIKISTINIFTSPFSRCIITAINLCNEISKEKFSIIKNIFIIKDLSELYSENNYKYDPTKSILYNNKESEKNLYEEFIGKHIYEKCYYFKNFESNYLLKYPEELEDGKIRYEKIGNEILNYIKTKCSAQSINIIVSHGIGVEIITKNYLNLIKEDKEKAKRESNNLVVYLCSSFCFNIINNSDIKYVGEILPLDNKK